MSRYLLSVHSVAGEVRDPMTQLEPPRIEAQDRPVLGIAVALVARRHALAVVVHRFHGTSRARRHRHTFKRQGSVACARLGFANALVSDQRALRDLLRHTPTCPRSEQAQPQD